MGKRRKREFCSLSPPTLQLLSDVELFDDRPVAVDIGLGQVVQKVSSVTNHLKQTAAGMMIVRILLQMLGQLIDASSQDRDLDFGGTGILLVQLIGFDHRILGILFQHFTFHLSFRFVRPELRRRPVKGAHPSSVILTASLLYTSDFKK